MDFIALTLQEAKEKAQESGTEFKVIHIDCHSNSVNDHKWRVVKQEDVNGVINLYLMVEA